MQQFKFIAALIAIAIGTGGCFVAIGNGGHSHRPNNVPPADDGSVIAEMEAAARLFSDRDKADVLKAIAARPNLSGKAQVCLVKTAVGSIFSENSKAEVLLALVGNPCFNDAGKKAVLSNLNRLFSDNHKKQILQAINDREMGASAVQVEAVVEVTARTEL